ncbi:hypothetical protein BE221DRAFT_80031, partial [Ostreococcus tauri]
DDGGKRSRGARGVDLGEHSRGIARGNDPGRSFRWIATHVRPDRGVVDDGEARHVGEFTVGVLVNLLHPVQKRQAHHGREFVHLRPELIHQVKSSDRGPTRGDQIVDQHHAIPFAHASEPHHRLIRRILRDVLPARHQHPRQLSSLTYHHERNVQRHSDRWSEQESARVESRHVRRSVRALRPVPLHEHFDHLPERLRVLRDPGDVVKRRHIVRGVLRAVPREGFRDAHRARVGLVDAKMIRSVRDVKAFHTASTVERARARAPEFSHANDHDGRVSKKCAVESDGT